MTSPTRLEDRYQQEKGAVFLTGIQALVRFLIDKQRRDERMGEPVRRTFISGYEGSPLGGLDLEIFRNLALLNRHGHFVHQPAVNEKIAAAAVHGSQFMGDVDGFWYGKSHGLKWTPDEMGLANFSGTGTQSGVVLFCGDDHAAKSSVYPAASEMVLKDMKVATFYPATVGEVLTLASHALALSRYSGLITALKLVTSICDGAATVAVDPDEPAVVLPRLDGRSYQKHFHPLVLATASVPIEQELLDQRLEVARAYARTNPINRIVNPEAPGPVGIVTAGKSYTDLLHMLADLGLVGQIRILKLGLIYPLEPEIVRQFARDLETVLVLEEKGPFLEEAVAHSLFGTPVRAIYGKRGPDGKPFIPAHGELHPDLLVGLLEPWLQKQVPAAPVGPRLQALDAIESRSIPAVARRMAHYCPGCPHNTSAWVPDGGLAGGEIGCSSIDAYIKAEGRGVRYIPAMGLGGALHHGMFPFNGNQHLFQNVGDGTVLHSGVLSLLSSVAHNANITYKILWNHVVAMTGGQNISGQPALDEFVVSLLGLGIGHIALVTPQPKEVNLKKARRIGKERLSVHHRDDYAEVQRQMAVHKGVGVIIFDQECATERRRRWKRQDIRPERYLFINERVCEGCGDCGRHSLCLALYPVQTEFGEKTRILQSACNRDETCLKGDCPAFVTVYPDPGVGLKRPDLPEVSPDELTEPVTKVALDNDYQIYLIGIGGTGVVTASQILGFAAMFEGKYASAQNRTGLAQKGGAVESPLILSSRVQPPWNQIAAGRTDLYLVADLLGGVHPANLRLAAPDRTVAVVSTSPVPTAEMVYNPKRGFPDVGKLQQTIDQYTRAQENIYLDAQNLTVGLFNNHIFTNIFLLGVAYQAGLLPLQADSIEQAIRLNGQAVATNIQAFRWGRLYRLDCRRVEQAARLPPASAEEVKAEIREGLRRQRRGTRKVAFFEEALQRVPIAGPGFGHAWAIRVGALVDYQGIAYARRYVETVARIYAWEGERLGEESDWIFTQEVAFYLYKLMAYKDEYEVARLLTGAEEKRLKAQFNGPVKISYNLQPPFLRSLGLKKKLPLGGWFRPFLRGLVAFRWLRGTPLDPFGYLASRQQERALIEWYQHSVERIAGALTPANYELALHIARAPDRIRGYEEIRQRSIEKIQAEVNRLVEALVSGKTVAARAVDGGLPVVLAKGR